MTRCTDTGSYKKEKIVQDLDKIGVKAEPFTVMKPYYYNKKH